MADERISQIGARAADIAARGPLPRALPDAHELPGHADGLAEPHGRWKVGLVLAGGAAKGGYQVGVAEALAAAGTRLHAVAGTSIGALNGAVLAAEPDLTAGAARLGRMWVRFTEAVGEPPFTGDCADGGEGPLAQAGNLLPRVVRLLGGRGLLEELVADAVGEDGLAAARPFYLATYRVLKPIPIAHVRALQYVLDTVRRWAGTRSRILHVNELSAEQAREAILASAALPLLFPARFLEDGAYRDGMLGGDNVPIRALAQADCRVVIVVHLDQGTLVDPAEFPDLVILEIRPSIPLNPDGPLGGLSGPLDFSPQSFARLRALGRADATRVLASLRQTLEEVGTRRAAQAAMVDAVERLSEPVRFPTSTPDSPPA